jgi:hypothetical protein
MYISMLLQSLASNPVLIGVLRGFDFHSGENVECGLVGGDTGYIADGGSMFLKNVGNHINDIFLLMDASFLFVFRTFYLTLDECVKLTNLVYTEFCLVNIQF